MRRRQAAGEIADDLDPALLFLLFEAAAASLIYPADARAATGLDPASPEFAERYAELLRRVVKRLAIPAPQDA